MKPKTFTCRLCRSANGALAATFDRRPPHETNYGIDNDRYVRHVYRCFSCGVYYQAHDWLPADLYERRYNDVAHEVGFRARFDAITALPPERSDNKQRALRVHNFLVARGFVPEGSDLLDIGTGLCVFLAAMRTLGYRTFGVDPDVRAVRHAQEVVGVNEAWVDRLETLKLSRKFDIVTLNKVLEHVAEPLPCLRNAAERMKKGGLLYVELPDGEAAAAAASVAARQEFVIEHLTIFTPRSLLWLLEEAGLSVLRLERCHEPSGKYTLFAFATA